MALKTLPILVRVTINLHEQQNLTSMMANSTIQLQGTNCVGLYLPVFTDLPALNANAATCSDGVHQDHLPI